MDTRIIRNVLQMVSELHVRGYQRIRIAPGMSPSGCSWRCAVTPASNIMPHHGARLRSWDHLTAHYTSGMGAHYFDWKNAAHATPSAMARLFIARFPKIVAAGRGSDWMYAGWYVEMLHLTYPDAFPIAYADWSMPDDVLATTGNGREVSVPLPPLPLAE